MRKTGHLMALGCGYSASRLAGVLLDGGWQVSGTSRTTEGCRALATKSITPHLFDGSEPLPPSAWEGVTHCLVSIPPDENGDQSLLHHRDRLASSQELEWIGVLSTTGVYGDAAGQWIDETFPPSPLTEANRRRLAMEEGWLDFAKVAHKAVQIFRLPGIYGPGRSPFSRIRSGQARSIIKPGQVFNRIHVDDIVAACLKGIERPFAGPVFHIADGNPAASDDVLDYAASLLGQPSPPRVPIAEAGLPPMAMHFYDECKRLDISRARTELGFVPRYADYREGLISVLAEEQSRSSKPLKPLG
ncbi:SDR family oxidoreductase [uncultured Cohaesibacter sp.]|uniref:SDR family oxidoreductase n=1 Tax=uncultured Cohaesibacter sp. TaxID=1002546 RepID=UPI0029C85EBE|nr:SDR family oxidoreductase [uncultured Cohaesibacter sp.]